MASAALLASAELYGQRLRLAHKLMEADRQEDALRLTVEAHGRYADALRAESDVDEDAISVTESYLESALDLLTTLTFGEGPYWIH